MRGRRLLPLLIILLLAAPLAGLHRAPIPARAQDGTIPLPVAVPGAHPRLLITPVYVAQTLKARAAEGAAPWTTFAAYVESGGPEDDAEWTPGTALRSLALAWLVTGDAAYGQRAVALLRQQSDRLAAHPVMNGRGGLDGEFMEAVADLALGYDWLYAALDESDRAALADRLLRAADRLRDPASDTNQIVWLDGQLMAFGNTDPRWLWALTAVGLALNSEQAAAAPVVEYAREVFTTTVLPALDLQTGGAWAEGPVYGFLAIWPKVQTALAWWTAAGENYFDDTPWWYDRLAYDMFLYYPTPARTYHQDWGDPIHNYPSIIGDSERYHAAAAWGRAQDLLLRSVFAGTQHGEWMDWFLRQPPDALPDWLSVEEFLWRDPGRSGTPPDTLTWAAPYLGHVFLRSNWAAPDGALDQSATYVSFNAGDRLAYHQFYDQGSFTIFHNGSDLVVRSGVYSGDGTSDHDANYYVRSIAANTLLICDLAENFDEIRPNGERDVWLNDCGQRTMRPYSRTAINRGFLFEHWQAYDTGSITRLGEIGGVTYLRADITGAYNSTVYTTPENRAKVSLVLRELVYWRPGTVLVHDRVITTYPDYTPMQVFHFQTEPTPSGLFYGSLVGNSALYLQNFLPGSRVSVVSGYQVAGQPIDKSWGEPVSNNFESQPYGFYRLEITPPDLNLDHWFLAGFTAQDAADPPPAQGSLVLGDTLRGAVMGPLQVMFDPDPGDGADITAAAFRVPADVENSGVAVEAVLVTGLQPGTTYRVETEGSQVDTLTANDAGMILIAGMRPGTVTLKAE